MRITKIILGMLLCISAPVVADGVYEYVTDLWPWHDEMVGVSAFLLFVCMFGGGITAIVKKD